MQFHETRDILGCDLDSERCPQSIGVERAQIFVEISELWRKGDRFDAGLPRPVNQNCRRAVARRIDVTGDIEPA